MNFMVNHPDMITLDPSEINQKKKQMELIYVSIPSCMHILYFHPALHLGRMYRQ